MAEATLTSDFLIALCDGVQGNKGIEGFYRKFDDDFPDVDKYESIFDTVMSVIGDCYNPQELAKTNWSRVHLFYTLFTSIAHLMFGINGVNIRVPHVKLSSKILKLRLVLDNISSKYDEYSAIQGLVNVPEDFAKFIDVSRRGTTDTGSRQYRSNFLCKAILEAV